MGQHHVEQRQRGQKTLAVPDIDDTERKLRLRVVIRGAVQGVGFRPFVYRLAKGLNLSGWVRNDAQGVFIEVEGNAKSLENFLSEIQRQKPPRAFIQSQEHTFLDPSGYSTFEIRDSTNEGTKLALVLPDIAVCDDCVGEIFDASNRRYRYPFTNCTNCGPRFSIIEALPYDRSHTTMKNFVMCEQCHAEYLDPDNRRFHAQPNACPNCGPHLELWDAGGHIDATHHEALLAACEAIRSGAIVAIKGLGGFQLLVDARNAEAVGVLRQKKHREEKPFALMYPTLGLVRKHCQVARLEERLLLSPESPIVLLQRKVWSAKENIAANVAPGNPYWGVMLPYTPLHHLLMAELGFPVVATSGNLSDEPICIDEHEALTRLSGIADFFLVHNRPIVRHVDDSIVRMMMGQEMVLRRARGYAPLPVQVKVPLPAMLAVGAHLKNTVAVSVGKDVFSSQHIGDLETPQSMAAFHEVTRSLQTLYDLKPVAIVCDQHPEYLSTKFAMRLGLPVVPVQHHYAHVLAGMAENEVEAPALGVSWDGTGYGLDGTVWGGEFLLVDQASFERAGHLRTFRLPGGEKAIKEPKRSALGLLYEIFGERIFATDGSANVLANHPAIRAFSPNELVLLQRVLTQQINAPLTSSVGRLFDAIAAIVDLQQIVKYEGQGAMALEFALADIAIDASYAFELHDNAPQNDAANRSDGRRKDARTTVVIDWEPMIQEVLQDVAQKIPVGIISAKFHNCLVEIIVAMAKMVGERRVILTGGCFQNKYLTERAIQRLRREHFRPYWHQRFPPNDGGIALGQIIAGARSMQNGQFTQTIDRQKIQ